MSSLEYKHKPNQPAGVRERPGTVVFKEYSVDEGDPYYPVPNPDNQALFEKYRALAAKEPGVLFVGRLASYKCVPVVMLACIRGQRALGADIACCGVFLCAQVLQHGPGDPERAGAVRRRRG